MILVEVDYNNLVLGKKNKISNFSKIITDLVNEFIESGKDCCEVVDETHMCNNSDTIRITMSRIVSEGRYPCKVIRLSGRIYLKRIDGDENGKD